MRSAHTRALGQLGSATACLAWHVAWPVVSGVARKIFTTILVVAIPTAFPLGTTFLVKGGKKLLESTMHRTSHLEQTEVNA